MAKRLLAERHWGRLSAIAYMPHPVTSFKEVLVQWIYVTGLGCYSVFMCRYFFIDAYAILVIHSLIEVLHQVGVGLRFSSLTHRLDIDVAFGFRGFLGPSSF